MNRPQHHQLPCGCIAESEDLPHLIVSFCELCGTANERKQSAMRERARRSKRYPLSAEEVEENLRRMGA